MSRRSILARWRQAPPALVLLSLFAGASLASGGCRKDDARGANAAPLEVPPGLLVAHALGRIDGMDYTNSLEALRCNHRRGFRWFEVDLTLSRDAELIAFHTRHEKSAGFDRPIDQLDLAEVRGARYRNKYPIVTFADVIGEARALGDVVLVTDTKTWPAEMLRAVERVVTATPEPRPGIVLQAYSDTHLAAVSELARKIDAGVVLSLYKTRASDPAVARLAQQFGLLAIVASEQRFSPWLAERLDAIQVPILVYTINDHDRIVNLTRAGADGFYTDSYVPYERMAAERHTLLDCGAAKPSPGQLSAWLRRDITADGDFRLGACAKRRRGRVELGGCGDRSGVTSAGLSVPPGSQVRIELDVESPSSAVDFWFHVIAKDGVKRRREKLQLAAGERRTLTWDVELPGGSPALELQLGLPSREARLDVTRFEVTARPGAGTGELPATEEGTEPRG